MESTRQTDERSFWESFGGWWRFPLLPFCRLPGLPGSSTSLPLALCIPHTHLPPLPLWSDLSTPPKPPTHTHVFSGGARTSRHPRDRMAFMHVCTCAHMLTHTHTHTDHLLSTTSMAVLNAEIMIPHCVALRGLQRVILAFPMSGT